MKRPLATLLLLTLSAILAAAAPGNGTLTLTPPNSTENRLTVKITGSASGFDVSDKQTTSVSGVLDVSMDIDPATLGTSKFTINSGSVAMTNMKFNLKALGIITIATINTSGMAGSAFTVVPPGIATPTSTGGTFDANQHRLRINQGIIDGIIKIPGEPETPISVNFADSPLEGDATGTGTLTVNSATVTDTHQICTVTMLLPVDFTQNQDINGTTVAITVSGKLKAVGTVLVRLNPTGTLTWNANATGSPADGGGNWNTTTTNWWLGTSNLAWGNEYNDTAQFGFGSGHANAYSVTLDTPITAGGLIFKDQAYTLSANTLTLANSPTITTTAASASIGSNLAGSTLLTKNGPGTLALTNTTNDYTGNVTLTEGTLALKTGRLFSGWNDEVVTLGSGAALEVGGWSDGAATCGIGESQFGAAQLVINGGTVRYAGTATETGNSDRNFTIGTGGATLEAAGTVQWSLLPNRNGTALAGGTNQPLNLTGSGNGRLGFAFNLGSGSLTKSGAGNWTLNATNATNTGGTTVNQGILNVTNGTFNTGTFYVGKETALTGVVNQTGGTLSPSGNQLLIGNLAASGIYNLSGGILKATDSSLGVVVGVNTDSTGTFTLSGSGRLSMTPSSTLQITRSDGAEATNVTGTFNQTAGSATVGVLSMGGSTADSANNAGQIASLNLSGGTFSAVSFAQLSGGNNSTSAIVIGGTAQVTLPAFPTARGAGASASVTFDGGTLSPAAASATYLGGLTHAYLTVNGAKLDIPTSNNISIFQNLENAPSQSGTLTKQGAGTLILTGSNSYSGATTVSAGTLALGTDNALPHGAGKGHLTLGGTLDLAGFDQTLNALNGGGLVDNLSAGGTPLLAVGAGDADSRFSGVIQNTSGVLGLAKVGSGTFTLSGKSSYAGPTTISSGTLRLAPASRVVSFTTTGTTTWTAPAGVTGVKYLVVGGGGGGGRFGGGGGAGGYLTGTTAVSPGTGYSITVGPGGAGTSNGGAVGGNGGNSAFGAIATGRGGGGGGSRNLNSPMAGVSGSTGGSGGGGSAADSGTTSGGAGTAGQGNAGGGLAAVSWGSGGGGGAGTAGNNASGGNSAGNGTGGDGGAGLANDITGASVFYAGGGGGATFSLGASPGAGGKGGGGVGTKDDTGNGGAGAANTGGGGGGGGLNAKGGNGGSGIVVLSYLDPSASPTAILPATSDLLFSAGATLDLNGISSQVASLADSGGGSVDNSATGTPAVLTLSPADGLTKTFSGGIGGIGEISLVMKGSGTQILAGPNTFTGLTHISQGTLLVNRPGTLDSAAVTVAGGATFGGTGAAGGSVTWAPAAKASFTVTSSGGEDNTTPMLITGVMTCQATQVRLNLPQDLPQGIYTLAISDATPVADGDFPAPVLDSGSYASGASGVVSVDSANRKLVLTVSTGIANFYQTWASGGENFTALNGEGVAYGLAWILGAANPGATDTVALLPTPAQSAGGLTLTFKRVHEPGAAKLYLQYSSDLATWNTPGVEIPADLSGTGTLGADITYDATRGSSTDAIILTIPATHAVDGKLFGRLTASEN